MRGAIISPATEPRLAGGGEEDADAADTRARREGGGRGGGASRAQLQREGRRAAAATRTGTRARNQLRAELEGTGRHHSACEQRRGDGEMMMQASGAYMQRRGRAARGAQRRSLRARADRQAGRQAGRRRRRSTGGPSPRAAQRIPSRHSAACRTPGSLFRAALRASRPRR
eukprot:scaffold1259_cov368-Prasinococcus_capsulatus_cf.AAC.10